MKQLLYCLVLCPLFTLHAQTGGYEKVDSFAQAFKEPFQDAADLAHKLTGPYKQDLLKARVIFSWLAFNIRYDYKKYKDPPPKPHFRAGTRQELERQMAAWEEEEIRATLRKKKGVCADYSRLFQKMCESAGLESVIIGGDSRRRKGGGSHAWNAVKIDGRWLLLDATWAAGVIDSDDERFEWKFSPGFFDTPPALFILNHLPDDEKWQLLGKPLSRSEFRQQALVDYGGSDYLITAFQPANGVLSPAAGQAEIRLRIDPVPLVFIVVAGQSRMLPVRVVPEAEGWTMLKFDPGSASQLQVFVGDTQQKTRWIAQFRVTQ